MKKYYNMITLIGTFLLGSAAGSWILYDKISRTKYWNGSMDFIIHSEPITYLVYGFLGGWFVSGVLAVLTIWLDGFSKQMKKGNVYGAVASIGGALVVGIFGFVPYAILNTKQYGLHIFADRKREKDNSEMKKDIAGVVFIICSTIMLLVVMIRTYYRAYKYLWGGLILCGLVIFEGVRKMHELEAFDSTDVGDEFEPRKAERDGKWDLMQSSMDGLREEERITRMCEHLSAYIPYYMEAREGFGVMIEGGFFLEEREDGVKEYLYILRGRDNEGYISEKHRDVWEYWILLGYHSPEDSLLEDLTEEWMQEFMDEFYEKLSDLYHRKNRKAAQGTGRELSDMKIYMC